MSVWVATTSKADPKGDDLQQQQRDYVVGCDRNRADLPVGALARCLAGRQGIQAVAYHCWN